MRKKSGKLIVEPKELVCIGEESALMMDFVKPLGVLIAECGDKVPEFPDTSPTYFVRTFPTIRNITDENITEKIFVDIMSTIFANKKKDMWFERRVNLWELANIKDPHDAVKRFKNPLQPDIDLLYGHSVNRKRQAPMVGVEVKLFSRYTGYGKKLPKTTSYEGYYAGLDEAVALLTLGLDCVYLWHVHVFPCEAWERYLEYGDDFFQKIVFESHDLGTLGSAWLCVMIKELAIPIGYVNTYLLIDPEKEIFWVFINIQNSLGTELNPLSLDQNAEPIPTRRLLLESFNVERIKTRINWMFCPRCKRDFSFRLLNYKFCPYCGTKLESKV